MNYLLNKKTKMDFFFKLEKENKKGSLIILYYFILIFIMNFVDHCLR